MCHNIRGGRVYRMQIDVIFISPVVTEASTLELQVKCYASPEKFSFVYPLPSRVLPSGIPCNLRTSTINLQKQ